MKIKDMEKIFDAACGPTKSSSEAMTENPKVFGQTMFSYTVSELFMLQECIKRNGCLIYGLSDFVRIREGYGQETPIYTLIEFWLPFAMRAAEGIDLVEEHFGVKGRFDKLEASQGAEPVSDP